MQSPDHLTAAGSDAPLASGQGGGDPVELYRASARVLLKQKEERIAYLESQVERLKNPGDKTQAQVLIEIGERATLFHSPERDAFAAVVEGKRTEILPLRSKSFRTWLVQQYYEFDGKPPGTQAVQDAIGILEAKALYDGMMQDVPLRTGWHEGSIYVDLCDDARRTVHVTEKGWMVVYKTPVRFRRTKGMQPLPNPMGVKGDLSLLKHHMGLKDAGSVALLCAYLAASLRPSGPYPILNLQGEQGSGKSTKSRQIRSLIDPSVLPVRTQPRHEQDLLIAAHNSWLLALDNLSGMPPWLSDAFCRLSTGGGFSTRELYSDKDESMFYATRPVLLNGIEDLATRPDLADRCITINLPRISETERKTEDEVWRTFERDRPAIFAGMLDVLSAALRNFGTVESLDLPRMADFAKWAVAGEKLYPVPEGTFFAAYVANRKESVNVAVEADSVATAILSLLGQKEDGCWEGTAGELKEEVRLLLTNPDRPPRDFPGSSQAMSGRLRRLMPALRAMGVEKLELERGINRRPFRLVRTHDDHDKLLQAPCHAESAPDSAEEAVYDKHDKLFLSHSKREGIGEIVIHGDGADTPLPAPLEQECKTSSFTSCSSYPANVAQNSRFLHDDLHDVNDVLSGDRHTVTNYGEGARVTTPKGPGAAVDYHLPTDQYWVNLDAGGRALFACGEMAPEVPF